MNHDYSRHYARFHPDTAEHDLHLRALLIRWLRAHLPADRHTPILDVGCGRGYALRYLRELGYTDLAGIDPDPGQVAFARQLELPVELAARPIEFLRQQPARYGLVLLMDVLEHVAPSDHGEFLAALHGCLRPGGILVCTVPNAASSQAAYWRYLDHTHRTLFTAASLEFTLGQCGFRVARIEGLEFFFRPRWLFWLPSRRSIQWWLLAAHRLRWRLAFLAELGLTSGRAVVLSPNLLARAVKD